MNTSSHFQLRDFAVLLDKIVIIVFLGTLVGIAISDYRSYGLRRLVAEGLDSGTESARQHVERYYRAQHRLPATGTTGSIGGAVIEAGGVVRLDLGPLSDRLAGTSLRLVPEAGDGGLRWTCRTIGPRSSLLPESCRDGTEWLAEQQGSVNVWNAFLWPLSVHFVLAFLVLLGVLVLWHLVDPVAGVHVEQAHRRKRKATVMNVPMTVALAREANDIARGSQRDTGEHEDSRGLKPGSVLAGRYRLEEKLGEVAWGDVWKARDLHRDERAGDPLHVAVKILDERFLHNPEGLRKLQLAWERHQRLVYPNIGAAYACGFIDAPDDGRPFLVMEVLALGLDVFIRKWLPPGGMSFTDSWPLIEDIGRGLQYAHEHGTAHQQVSPGNCFLTDQGAIKIVNFGMRRPVAKTDIERMEKEYGEGGGYPVSSFTGVELFEGHTPIPNDDIYGLACVTYILLTGTHPFMKKPAVMARDKQLVPLRIEGLSRRQWKTLKKGLAFTRSGRSASVAEFLEGLSPSRRRGLLGVLR